MTKKLSDLQQRNNKFRDNELKIQINRQKESLADSSNIKRL